MKNRFLTEYGFIDPIGFESKTIQQIKAEKAGGNKMVSLRDSAKTYEPPKTLNITDLKEISTEIEIKTRKFQKTDGEEFEIEVFEFEGNEYRIPVSVKKQLKEILEEKPDMTKFKVKKSGEGMNTNYTVIPLD